MPDCTIPFVLTDTMTVDCGKPMQHSPVHRCPSVSHSDAFGTQPALQASAYACHHATKDFTTCVESVLILLEVLATYLECVFRVSGLSCIAAALHGWHDNFESI